MELWDENRKKLKKSRLLKVSTYISSGITILLALTYLFKNIIFYIFLRISSGGADSIGIIGGADGPTAIFVATKIGHLSLEILILIFAVITTILFLLKTANKNKQ